VTTSETAAPPRPECSTAEALLRAETAPAPACRPAALFDAVPAARPRLLWQAPGEPALVAVGRAVRVAPRIGPDSGSAAGAAAEAVAGLGAAVAEELAALLARGEAPPPGLRVLFTVAFDPSAAFGAGEGPERWRGFAPVEAFVPEILVRCSEGAAGEAVLVGSEVRLPELRAELAGMAAAASGAGRPRPAPEGDLVVEWAEGEHRANVVAALEALRRPGLSKVVLAHVVEVRRDRPFSPAALLDALARAHPSCFPFAVQPAPGAPVFLGASPERLARVEDVAGEGGPRRVLSGALAGSAPRGTTPEEDDALGRRLLASAKDRAEHAIVGEMIAGALGPLCLGIDRGGEPALERLSNVQHLFTPISGTLRPGRGLFDAVAALHPTPAVGGMPRERALAAIRELEREPRGLYAGVVGWADLAGRGDSAVAIRSALVDGARARLFAGGGIVPTSDPDVEVEETRLKMAAVLGALQGR
jgi:isochorismate synthase